MTVFVIKKLVLDNFENQLNNACRYENVGYVDYEQTAIDICIEGKLFTSKDCWAIGSTGMKEFIYAELKYFSGSQ